MEFSYDFQCYIPENPIVQFLKGVAPDLVIYIRCDSIPHLIMSIISNMVYRGEDSISD